MRALQRLGENIYLSIYLWIYPPPSSLAVSFFSIRRSIVGTTNVLCILPPPLLALFCHLISQFTFSLSHTCIHFLLPCEASNLDIVFFNF